MKIEIFALCDFARNYGGKLTMNGPFDHIVARRVPTSHHACSLALRIRFSKGEEGKHSFKVLYLDADGTQLMPELSGVMDVKVPPRLTSSVVDLAITIGGLPIPHYGDYALTLTMNKDEKATLPIQVIPPADQSKEPGSIPPSDHE